jgi:peroxiredoxin
MNAIRLSLWAALVLLSISASSQGHYLFYKLNGAQADYVVLFNNRGENTKAIDTAYRQQSGGYAFMNIQKYPPGVYTVMFDDSTYTELIFNNESIVLESDYNDILLSMQVKSSLENKILFNYWKYAIMVKDSINRNSFTLQRILQKNGGVENSKTEALRQEIDALQDRLFMNVKKSMELYPNALAPKLLYSYQIPNYQRFLDNPDNLPYTDEMEFYRYHFFDYIDFSDPRMLNTRVIYVAVSDYMKNFGSPASTSGYRAIIDEVMRLAKANPEVYHYCLYLFINNFDNTIWEDVFAYTVDTYVPQLNENYLQKEKDILDYYRKKAIAIKKLKPGKEAPNFVLSDTSGQEINMHKVKAKAKMLVFYSSDCPHCEEAMPQLIEIYKQYKDMGVEFIGIAIDDEREVWLKDLQRNQIPWISVSDLQGMMSPLIETYNIWMTPTMIILDKKNVIMKKPKSEAEIHSTFLQLLYKE